MAIAVSITFPGGDIRLDEKLRQAFVPAGSFPPGGLLRLAGPVEGAWRVFSVWASEADWERFKNERLVPGLQQMGLKPDIEVSPLASVLVDDRLQAHFGRHHEEASPPSM